MSREGQAERASPCAPPAPRDGGRGWLLALAVALVFALDASTRLATNITRDDPAELQVLALAGGIPHGTSYPFYMALLRAFAAVPLGSAAYRMNLLSTVCGALTLLALAAFAARWGRDLGARAWTAGAFAAGVLGLSFTFTRVSIFTGMYTLHTAMAFAMLGAFARWLEEKNARDLELSLALLGSMLSNHVMTVALVPPVAALLAWDLVRDVRARGQWRNALRGVLWAALLFVVLDVLLFAVLWKNHVPFDHWACITSAPRFFDVSPEQARSFWFSYVYEATCRQFRFDVVGASWGQRAEQLALLVPRLAAELSPAIVLLAAVGAVKLRTRSKKSFALAALVVLTHAWLASGYRATEKASIYLLPVTGVVACLAAYGALFVAERVRRSFPRTIGPEVAAQVGFVLVGLLHVGTREGYEWCVSELVPRSDGALVLDQALGRRPNEHDEHATLDEARRTVSALPPEAIVFADWRIAYTIHYVARYERGIHDLQVYEPFPYGVGGYGQFPIDYRQLVLDPNRKVPVFFQGKKRPPPIPGFAVVQRSPELVELVREPDPDGT